MRLTFDPAKNNRNIATRDLPFELVADIDWETAFVVDDRRRDYGERRLQVYGLIGHRLHVAVITRRADAVHVISFRKANSKEVTWYGQRVERL
jgi:uncharacterized DUF497 family protein